MMTVDEMLDRAADHARTVLVGKPGAELIPTWLIQETGRTVIVGTPWGGDDEKNFYLAILRGMLKKLDVVSYSFMSEAWMAHEDPKHPTGLMPREREDRQEVVIINAFDRKGGKMRAYEMKRGADGAVVDLVKQGEDYDRLGGRMHNLFEPEDSH